MIICGDGNLGVSREDGVVDVCLCPDRREWNVTILECQIDCNIDYAVGNVDGDIDVCECV